MFEDGKVDGFITKSLGLHLQNIMNGIESRFLKSYARTGGRPFFGQSYRQLASIRYVAMVKDNQNE